jgi:hypothetical protein
MLYYQPLKSPRREPVSDLPCLYYIHCVTIGASIWSEKAESILCRHPAAPPWRQAASPEGEDWFGGAPSCRIVRMSYLVSNICTRSYQPRK